MTESEQKVYIEECLDRNDDEIMQLYYSWDKGDCSLAGLVQIYLLQCTKQRRNNVYGDGPVGDICLLERIVDLSK